MRKYSLAHFCDAQESGLSGLLRLRIRVLIHFLFSFAQFSISDCADTWQSLYGTATVSVAISDVTLPTALLTTQRYL